MHELDPLLALSIVRLLLAIAVGVMATSSLSHVEYFLKFRTLHHQLVWIMLILLFLLI
jgi:hypothetical protein